MNLQARFTLWPDHLPSDIRGLAAWWELGMWPSRRSQGYTHKRAHGQKRLLHAYTQQIRHCTHTYIQYTYIIIYIVLRQLEQINPAPLIRSGGAIAKQ